MPCDKHGIYCKQTIDYFSFIIYKLENMFNDRIYI